MGERTLEDDIATRLRRIEGQVRGIQRMLEEGRECEDMLTQTMAIRSAIDYVGARLMEYHLDRCLLDGFECDEERMTQLRGRAQAVDEVRAAGAGDGDPVRGLRAVSDQTSIRTPAGPTHRRPLRLFTPWRRSPRAPA